jgi:hypothetical protein
MDQNERELKRIVYGVLKYYINEPVIDSDIEILHMTETDSGWSAIASVSVFDGIYYEITKNRELHKIELSVYRKVKDEKYYLKDWDELKSVLNESNFS